MDPINDYYIQPVGGRFYRVNHATAASPPTTQQRTDMSNTVRLMMSEVQEYSAHQNDDSFGNEQDNRQGKPRHDRKQQQEPRQDDQVYEILPDDMVKRDGDTIVTVFECDPSMCGYLVGKQGANKARIEAASGAALTFNTGNSNNNNRGKGKEKASDAGNIGASGVTAGSTTEGVTIRGSDIDTVSKAYSMIQRSMNDILLGTKAARAYAAIPDYNYFISIPVQATNIVQAAIEFRSAAQKAGAAAAASADAKAATQAPSDDMQASGTIYDDTIFNKPEKLHITVCMLKLYSKQAREKARDILQDTVLKQIVQEVLQGTPLQVTCEGLEVMNGSHASTAVVYAKVEDSTGRLQRLCDSIGNAYNEAGLRLPADMRPVKIHMTVINTKYLKGPAKPPNGRISIDARPIMKAFETYSFGTCVLDSVHLSERMNVDNATGFYACLDSICLPS